MILLISVILQVVILLLMSGYVFCLLLAKHGMMLKVSFTYLIVLIDLCPPKRTNRPDSGLADLPDEEISRRARDRSLSGPERNKYREEEKVRGLRNKQKRKNYKRIDKDITDPHYFDLEPYPGYYDDHETNSSFIVPGIPGVPVFPFVPVFP